MHIHDCKNDALLCTLMNLQGYNHTVKSAQMPLKANQSYLDTHLLKTLYKETLAESITNLT